MKLCIYDYCSSPIWVFIVYLQQHSDIYHLLNHNNALFFKLYCTSQDFFFENKSFVEGDLHMKAWYDIVLTVCTNVGQCGLDFTKVNIMYRKMINMFTSQPEKWKKSNINIIVCSFHLIALWGFKGHDMQKSLALFSPCFQKLFSRCVEKNKL